MALSQPPSNAPPGLVLKAWVQIVPTTGAIVKAFNVASVVRVSTGNYTVTFTSAMATTAYVAVAHGTSPTVGGGSFASCALTTQAVGSTSVFTYGTISGGQQSAADLSSCYLAFYE